MSNLTSLEFFKQVLPIPSDGKEYFVVDIEPKYKVEGRKNGKTKIVHRNLEDNNYTKPIIAYMPNRVLLYHLL